MGKNQDLIGKRTKEKELVAYMIALYCRKNHKQQELCPECRELTEYACLRIDRCPYMEEKTFCSSCKTHCYQKEKRERIKAVMRWCGPRLLIYRPGVGLRHIWDTLCKKRKKK